MTDLLFVLGVTIVGALVLSWVPWLRRRWRIHRVRHYLRQVEREAYRESRGGHDAA